MAHNQLLTTAQFDHEELGNIFKPFKPTKHKLKKKKLSPKQSSTTMVPQNITRGSMKNHGINI